MPTPGSESPRVLSRRARWLRRACGVLAAIAALVSGGIVADSSPAEALPRGEVVSFPGGLIIANFVMPGGKRAYCIEVALGEPTGQAWLKGRLTALPGRTGYFHSWGTPNEIRQVNYLIDHHGQTKNAWTSAAVQLSIWRMRENFRESNPHLNQKMAVLNSSQKGRDLITKSNHLVADARAKAKEPVPAPAIAGKLAITPDPMGNPGRYRVAYPKGTVSLSATGGTFVRNGEATITVPGNEATARYVDLTPGVANLKVTGSWETLGQAGWKAELDVYDTSTASGAEGQRVAVATGKSSVPKRKGSFAAVTATPPPPSAPPVAETLAQPSAELGGTMQDELIIRKQAGTTLEMWPAATAGFTAYLAPEAGALKYDESWNPVLGDAYTAQREDEDTGELLWHTWWSDEAGEALRDSAGTPIPTTDHSGNPTAGVAADGTAYPVVQMTESGEPVLDDAGMPKYHTLREAWLEERRDPQRWTAVELAAMSEGERCLAQPVFHEAGIPVPGPGEVSSSAVTVRSGGTIHWVERIVSRGTQVHEGKCGIANETTRINQPGVVTKAPPSLIIGEEAFDTATVSGVLHPNLTYTIRFEAYRAPSDLVDGGQNETAPVCNAENIVFRSERLPVTGVGEIRSPGFTLGAQHGTRLWWVETLEVDEGDGPRPLHRGACGVANETTRIGQPAVETRALASGLVGEEITDTAILSGEFASNDGARWELTFQGHKAQPVGIDEVPVCGATNRIFSLPPVPVTGPGEVTSAPVLTRPEWRGEVWWVETLWLIQDGVRTAYATGACGIANETTTLDGPSVETLAVPLATVGDGITDTATVTGPLSDKPGIRYELTFAAYRGARELTGSTDAACVADTLLWESEPVAVTEPGDVTSPPFTVLPEHGDTIWWVESLWQVNEGEAGTAELGASRTLVSAGKCGVEHETTSVQRPTVATVATARVRVGEPLFDTAIVEGALSQREDIEYRVTFTAYERSADGEMSCSPETKIAELSDSEGVVVTGAGRYESRRTLARPEHVGLGGYVESLTMQVDGQQVLVHRGSCGAASENFEVVPADAPPTPGRPDLPRTGGNPQHLLGVAAAVLIVGGAATALTVVRRRRYNS